MKLLFSLLLLAAAFASPATALASRRLSLSFDGCSGLDRAEVERLTQLELATVGGGESDAGSAEVRVRCEHGLATLKAADLRTRRLLERSVPVNAEGEDADRLLAISIAQLVRALDWLPESEPAAPASQLVDRRAPPSGPVKARRPIELFLGAGPRARDPNALFAGYRARLGSVLPLGTSFGVGGSISYERGIAERAPLGRVRAELIAAALIAELEPWRTTRWGSLLQVQFELSRLSLRGVAQDSAVADRQVNGVGAGAELGLGPAVRFGHLRLALLAQGGAARFGGKGLVAGDEPVNLDGVWFGGELALRWALWR